MAPRGSQKKKPSKNNVVQEVTSESEIEEEEIESKIEKVIKKIMVEFKKEIRLELKEIEKSLTFNSEKIDDFINEMKEMREKQDTLMKENMELKEKVKTMEHAVEEMEQYSRNRNIQIDGIPIQKDENLEEMVKVISKEIDVEINNGEIDVVHRIPTRSKKHPEPIIVQFTTRRKRDEMIQKGKEKKINTTTFNLSGPTNDVYINEHLTKQRKQLVYEAKQIKKAKNYKFVWTKGGKVFIRKNETSNIIQLHTLEDLEKIQ